MPEIKLEHITKRWGKFYAVEDLNLTIADNSFVLSGARARLRIEFDIVDMNLQRATRNSAFDINRARCGVDRLPVDFAQLIFGAL